MYLLYNTAKFPIKLLSFTYLNFSKWLKATEIVTDKQTIKTTCQFGII